MDCSEFRKLHPSLLDETLPALDLVRAHRHMLECVSCASQDASIRRALLVFRNLSPIEPSREFGDRLNHRLAQVRAEGTLKPSRLPSRSAFALAAGLLLMVAGANNIRSSQSSMLTLPPALATRPDPAPSQLMTPAIAASLSAGFPVWPAMMMVEHASQQLADAEFQLVSYTPRR
jgi:hypothetical protein